MTPRDHPDGTRPVDGRRRRRPGRGAVSTVVALAGLAALLAVAPHAAAHPLGNFTVNTHFGVRVEPGAVAVDAVLDVAEVPTMRAFPELGAAGEEPARSQERAYRSRTCSALVDAVRLELDGAAVPLEVVDSALSFPAGEAGLPTARLECTLRSTAVVDTVGHEVTLEDALVVQPIGWREITAVGDGVTLAASDVPERSATDVLRSYPEGRLDDPSDQRSATLRVEAGSGVVTGAAGGAGRPPSTALQGLDPLTTTFTGLVSVPTLSVGVGVLAVALAVLLGTLHAFAPGHGKTVMAAYLVGRNGSLRQAALIGLSVTVTHTAGVLVLGVLISLAVLTAPEQVYPWLRLASGVLLVGIGVGLLRGARRPHRHHGHPHPHGHGHSHGHSHGHAHPHGGHGHPHPHGHSHSHGEGRGRPQPVAAGADLAVAGRPTTAVTVAGAPDHGHARVHHDATGAGRGHRQRVEERVEEREHRPAADRRGLLAVGFVGGMVPSPSALVVLLGGIALGRAWFGVLLVLAYGVGMALALVGIGLLLVRARHRLERWSARGRTSSRPRRALLAVSRRLPTLTAGLVLVVGVALTVQAVVRV